MKKKSFAEKIGLKVVSETELFWTKMKEGAELEIKAAHNSILLNEEIAKMAKEKIKQCTSCSSPTGNAAK